jgi:O-antigen/teichoic acid export membrane protein
MVVMTERVAWAMLILGVLTALVCWTLATPIVTLLGGARYGGAGGVLGLQCFAVITVFVGAAWQPALIGLGRLRALAVSLAVGLVVVVIAGAVLIPEFQAMGAAAAAVIADVALAMALYVALRRTVPAQWLPGGPSLRIAAAAAAAVGVGFVPGLPTAARAVLVVGVFLAAVVALRALPREIVHTLRPGTVFGR